MFLSPEIGAFGLYFNDNNPKSGTNQSSNEGTYSFYGANISGIVGYTFADAILPIDIFTGVVGQFGWCANNLRSENHKDKTTISGASWRFGFGLNPGRFSVRLMYDLRMGNHAHKEELMYFGRSRSINGVDGDKSDYKMLNKLSLSIAYNF